VPDAASALNQIAEGSTTTTRNILIQGFEFARLASSDAPNNPPRCPVMRGQHHRRAAMTIGAFAPPMESFRSGRCLPAVLVVSQELVYEEAARGRW
jgi:hypothetical protein